MKRLTISFDAGDTLFHGTAFSSIAKITNSSLKKVSNIFGKVKREKDKDWKDINIFTTNASLSAYWFDIYVNVIKNLVNNSDQANAIYSDLMYEREHGDWYKLNKGVLPTLESLSKSSLRLIVSSNWSTDLHKILERLDIVDFFDDIYTSCDLKSEKPMKEFYHTISKLEKTNIVHFGNDVKNDVEAPSSYGWEGVLIKSDDNFQDIVGNRLATFRANFE